MALGNSRGLNAEADGDDGVEVVEGGEISFAIAGSIPEFPDNCGFGQFSAVEDVLQVLTDCADINIEEDADELLGKPDGLVLHANFDALFPGLRGEDEELGGAVANLNFLRLAHNAAPIFLRWLVTRG